MKKQTKNNTLFIEKINYELLILIENNLKLLGKLHDIVAENRKAIKKLQENRNEK